MGVSRGVISIYVFCRGSTAGFGVFLIIPSRVTRAFEGIIGSVDGVRPA